MFYDQKLSEISIVAFDIETTGGYPIESDICEFAAVKWAGGKITGEFQSLFKPRFPMSDFIIGIHGITNEMVQSACHIEEKIKEIHNFFSDSFLVAHHCPFDMGFMAYEFEKYGLEFPTRPAFCSSLLSRKLFPESTNHRLQTLIQFFKLPQGTAHRALDDTKACLEVTLKCFEKIGLDKTVNDALKIQDKEITWPRFSIESIKNTEIGMALVKAMENRKPIQIIYGTDKNSTHYRPIIPKGIVRNPEGDFIHAFCEIDMKDKRFYLSKIHGVKEY